MEQRQPRWREKIDYKEVLKALNPASLSSPPQLALRNALRYFPPDVQKLLAQEFAQELRQFGHIYMYRFCPSIEMR